MTDLPKKIAKSGAKMVDVAREANVAVSTVSRALAFPDRINATTRRRVLEAADRLGFTPNLSARSLRVGASKTIMIILPSRRLSSSVVEAVTGLEEVLSEGGFRIVAGHIDGQTSSELHLLDMVMGGFADALAVLSGPLPVADGRSSLHAGIPVVSLLYDMSKQGIPSVITNERQALRTLVLSLLAQGHRKVVYVSAPKGTFHDMERLGGVGDALAEYGLPDGALTRIEGDFSIKSGTRAARAYLALPDRPTAVVCASDDMAMGFMKKIQEEGLSVPHDLVVSGFNGIAYTELTTPTLTTIEQPFQDVGRTGAKTLLVMLQGGKPEVYRQVLENKVRHRESTRWRNTPA